MIEKVEMKRIKEMILNLKNWDEKKVSFIDDQKTKERVEKKR